MPIERQRATIKYDNTESLIIQMKSNIIAQQMEIKHLQGVNEIHNNQEECGKQISNLFGDKKIVSCLVYGMTQTGKTGCMCSLIKNYVAKYEIPSENIYILGGLSDTEWEKDTKERMPQSMAAQVIHRAKLTKKFVDDEIRGKKNVLIIIDEIQLACQDGQTLNRIFKDSGFYDLDFLMDNDVKFVQFSATPDAHIDDIACWGAHSAKVKLEPGRGYYGAQQALEQGRVKQFKNLTDIKNVRALKSVIDENYHNKPLYHLIRVPNTRANKDGSNNQDIVISNFMKVFGSGFHYNCDYLKTKKDDINKILEQVPETYTFVFYCEILRAAKTQQKRYIGISYERYSESPDDSTILQASWGRMTGYDDNKISICYTNIPSLENYVKLWNNNMEFGPGIEWNTKTTRFNEHIGITASKKTTYNSVKNIDQLKDNYVEEPEKPTIEAIVSPDFDSFEETVRYGESKLRNVNGKMEPVIGKTKPRKPVNDINCRGFYEVNISGKMKVLSVEDVINYKQSTSGLNKAGGRYKIRPCYSNLEDPTTLEWRLVYFPIENDSSNESENEIITNNEP